MKKFLYATTALASVGMIVGAASDAAAAEKIRLGLSGYHQQFVNYTDQDIDTPGNCGVAGNGCTAGTGNKVKTNTVDQKHNSEICVIGETTLDNGLTIGVNVQIEANTSGDNIDETYLYVQHANYGQVILGDENNAGYLLHVTAPDGGINVDSGDLVNLELWNNTANQQYFNTAVGTTNLRFNDNDSGKMTYISPRFFGVQAGISYIPETENSGGDDNNGAYFNNTPYGRSGQGNNNQFHNLVAGGLNYKQDFSGFGVQLSLGALQGQNGRTAQGTGFSGSDLFAWNGGAQFSYAGFKFGGAYVSAPNKNVVQSNLTQTSNTTGATSTTPQSMQSSGWTVGGAYEWGPYAVGLTYQHGESEGTFIYSQDTRLDQVVLSGTYTLGPGIRLVGGFFGYDADAEKTPGNGPTYTGFDNSGWGAVTGLKLGF